jgi:hypothetical protein
MRWGRFFVFRILLPSAFVVRLGEQHVDLDLFRGSVDATQLCICDPLQAAAAAAARLHDALMKRMQRRLTSRRFARNAAACLHHGVSLETTAMLLSGFLCIVLTG